MQMMDIMHTARQASNKTILPQRTAVFNSNGVLNDFRRKKKIRIHNYRIAVSHTLTKLDSRKTMIQWYKFLNTNDKKLKQMAINTSLGLK